MNISQGVGGMHWNLAMMTSLVIHLLAFFVFSYGMLNVSNTSINYDVILDITLQPYVESVPLVESRPEPVTPVPVSVPIPAPEVIEDNPVQELIEPEIIEQSLPQDQKDIDEPIAVEQETLWVPEPVTVVTNHSMVVDEIRQDKVHDGFREEYLTSILRIIEAEKYYPRSARKRGYEDVVKVSFELMADGSIRDLSVSGRYSVLRSSAANAVRQSVPFPIPPKNIATPLLISYAMAFELN